MQIRRRPYKWLVILLCFLLAGLTVWSVSIILQNAQLSDSSPQDGYRSSLSNSIIQVPQNSNNILVVGGDDSNPPFSYLQNGQALGLDNDLMREIAKNLDMQVVFSLSSLAEVTQKLQDGTIDVIGGMTRTNLQDQNLLFGTPHAIQYFDLFVRRDSGINSISDLDGKTIIIQDGDEVASYLNDTGYTGETVLAADPLEALTWIALGNYEGALIGKIEGYYLIDKYHFSNLKGLGESINERYYGFVVRSDNRTLLLKMNQALGVIEASGTFDEISREWLSSYQQESFLDQNKYLLYWMVVLFTTAVIFVLWGWSSRRLVKRRTSELRASEKKYRQLIDSANEGIIIISNLRILYLNPQVKSIFNFSGEFSLEKINVLEHIHPKDHELVKIKYNQFMSNFSGNSQFSFRIITAKGITRWVRCNSVRIDWEGQPALLSFFSDITDERMLEESIKASEERYRLIFGQSPVGMFYYDTKLRITDVNDRLVEIMCLKRDQLIDFNLNTIKDTKIIKTLLKVRNGERGFFEGGIKHLISKNQSTLYVKLRTAPLLNERLEYQGGIGLLEDITAQVLSDRKIQNLEEKFAKVFYTSSDIIVISTLHDGLIIDVNRGFTELTGYTREEIIGKRVLDANLWVNLKDRDKLLHELKTRGEYKNLESLFRTKDGKIRTGLMSASIIEIDGEPCTISITRDIDEIKRANEIVKNSELRYRSIFEGVPVSIWEQDLLEIYDSLESLRKSGITDLVKYLNDHPEFVDAAVKSIKINDVNEASLKIYKATTKKQLLISLDKIFNQDSLENFKKELLAIWNHEPFFDGDSVNMDLDGNRVKVNVAIRIPAKREDFKKVLVSITDITQRKLAEEALRESEIRYRRIFNSVPVSIKQEDYSIAFKMLEEVRQSGVDNFEEFLTEHPEWVKMVVKNIKITEVNLESLEIYKADSKEQLLQTLDHYFLDESYINYKNALLAFWNHQSNYEQETVNKTLTGEKIDVWVSIAIPSTFEEYTRVLVTVMDITERKQAEEQIRLQVRYLAALRAVDMAISASMDLPITLRVLVNQVHQQLMADAVSILLLDPHTQTLKYSSGVGFQTNAIEFTNLRLGQSYAGQAALDRRIITADDLATKSSIMLTKDLDKEGFSHYLGVPLISKGMIKGVLELYNHNPFDQNAAWMGLLESMAGQAAIAIENSSLLDEVQKVNINLRSAYDATIEGWATSIDLRNGDMENHSKRVADLAIELAQIAGFQGEELLNLRRGALLHDVGMLGIPDEVLFKPGPLTDEERTIMKTHPVIAKRLLTSINFLHSSLDIPCSHHEYWDGTGFPDGLAGMNIPFAARIFAIVDCWDSLRSDRPWRKAWTDDNAWDYIENNSGKIYDPQLVEKFRQLLGHGFTNYF